MIGFRRRSHERAQRAPSDFTAQSGRLWSSDAPWNGEIGHVDDLRVDVDATHQFHLFDADVAVTVACPTRVHVAGANDILRPVLVGSHPAPTQAPRWLPLPADMPGGSVALVLTHSRDVVSLRGLTVDDSGRFRCLGAHDEPLDGGGFPSLAAGLLLQREIVAGVANHALRIAARLPLRTRVQLDPDLDLGRFNAAEWPIAAALQVYGGYVVDAPRHNAVEIHAQHPGVAADLGPVYRAHGIRSDPQGTWIPADSLRVLRY